MKYAVINQRGGISRISDTEPKFPPASTTVVEISDTDVALVTAGREAYPKVNYRWVDGTLVELSEAIEHARLLARPLEEVKAEKIVEIHAARQVAEYGGVTVAPFGTLPTDAETQAKLTAVYVKALNDPTYTKNWKVGKTTWVTLDAATIIAIGDAVEAHVQAQFDKEQTLTEAALAATTHAEVSAITY